MFVMCGHQWYYYNSLSIYLDPNGTPTATSLGCNLNVCTLSSSYTTPGKYKSSPKIQYQQESEMGITATVWFYAKQYPDISLTTLVLKGDIATNEILFLYALKVTTS